MQCLTNCDSRYALIVVTVTTKVSENGNLRQNVIAAAVIVHMVILIYKTRLI